MRSIQILGLVVSTALVLYSFKRHRDGDFSRRDLLFAMVLAAGVGVIALRPSVADAVKPFLSLEDRWMTIFIVADLVIVVGFYHTLGSLRSTQRSLGEFVRRDAKRSLRPRDGGEGEVCVLVPAYNEANSITSVLERVPDRVLGMSVEPLVVVDGGGDGTEAIVGELPCSYVVHGINQGQGAALRTGFELALERGAEVVVTMDADGQHLPEELERVAGPVVRGDADFVIGSRFLGEYEVESRVRHLGILFFTRLIRMLNPRARITDGTSGYRAFSREILERLELSEDRFNAPELIIDAAKKGFRIVEVPITVKRRVEGESKKPGIGYGIGLGRTIFRTLLR